jgi:hypothetical protein
MMNGQRRRRINKHTAAEVAYSVDLRCCLCEATSGFPPRARNGQIHHMDGDPRNNDLNNLVWLCLEHHEDAGKTGKTSRRLSPLTIGKFRDLLLKKVASTRVLPKPRRAADRRVFLEAFDAQVVLDIRKLEFRIGNRRDWEAIEQTIREVFIYPDTIGFEAKIAILEFLHGLACSTRYKMPESIASAICHATLDHTRGWFLNPRGRERLSKQDIRLMGLGADIGFSLAYDGIRYLDDLAVASEGCELLWRYLSYANINRNKAMKKIALDEFARLRETAGFSKNPLAVVLVETAQRHGESMGTRFPDYPEALLNVIFGRRT